MKKADGNSCLFYFYKYNKHVPLFEESRQLFSVSGMAIPYTLRHSSKRQSLAIRIEEDGGVRVLAPARLDEPVIERFLQQNIIGFIKLARRKRVFNILASVLLAMDKSFRFWGENLELQLIEPISREFK